MTIVVTAIYPFGIVQAADSAEVTQVGITFSGEQAYTSGIVDKIIELHGMWALLGMAGDSQIYGDGTEMPLRKWLIESFIDSGSPGITLRELAAAIWTNIDNQPATEYGQNSPSTLLLFGWMDGAEGYSISNSDDFDRTRGMDNHFTCKRLYINKNHSGGPAIFMAGFREARDLFQALYFGDEAHIDGTLRSFLGISDPARISPHVEGVCAIRQLDQSDLAKAKEWLRSCLTQLCKLWQLADKPGIGEPVSAFTAPPT